MVADACIFKGDSTDVLSVNPPSSGDPIDLDGNWVCRTSVVDRNNSVVVAARNVTDKNDDNTAFLVGLLPTETETLNASHPYTKYFWVIEVENSALSIPFRVETRIDLLVKPQGIE